MTEYFSATAPSDDHQFTEDPVYLEEVLVRTTDFQLNPGQNVGAPGAGFEIVDEIASWPDGFVPHWPFGAEHREFSETLGIPYEASQGYKEAMYPEYLPKLRRLMAEMQVKREAQRPAGTEAPRPAGTGAPRPAGNEAPRPGTTDTSKPAAAKPAAGQTR